MTQEGVLTDDEFLDRLSAHGDNQTSLARELGITRQAVAKRLQRISTVTAEGMMQETRELIELLTQASEMNLLLANEMVRLTWLMVRVRLAVSVECPPEVVERVNGMFDGVASEEGYTDQILEKAREFAATLNVKGNRPH